LKNFWKLENLFLLLKKRKTYEKLFKLQNLLTFLENLLKNLNLKIFEKLEKVGKNLEKTFEEKQKLEKT
jgi:hypothetical protein